MKAFAVHIAKAFFFILLTAIGVNCHADDWSYPVLPSLRSHSTNPLYRQYQQEVEEASKAYRAGKEPYLNFYAYTATEGDSIFTLAAKCSVPQDSIATVNHIENGNESLEGRTLLLPTTAGLYIPRTPKNSIEILLAKEHSVEIYGGNGTVCKIQGEEFYFLQGTRFSPEERAFFLDSGMQLPLESYVLTSTFGMRISPISGLWKFHRGIDMAAPIGTSIKACKSGVVKTVGKNDYTYGNYVLIAHDGGMTSMYAHMSTVSVTEGTRVSKGQEIGKVGVTGLSTGPHLHFEIKQNGQHEDPQKYIKTTGKRAH